MAEILIVLSLFVALVWVIVRAVLLVMRSSAPREERARNFDPIADYIEENYGSRFHGGPVSAGRGLRNL